MVSMMPTKVAVIQKPPAVLDRDKTIEQAVATVDEAAGAGATLLVFPEAYVPCYPAWIWRLKPGGDMALSGDLHARLRRNAAASRSSASRRGSSAARSSRAAPSSISARISVATVVLSRARRAAPPAIPAAVAR